MGIGDRQVSPGCYFGANFCINSPLAIGPGLI
jgi:hypothetical protein